MQRFTDLKVWQRAHKLVLEVYTATKTFPADERFGLTSQIRRAATPVPTNIAEGSKRRRRNDFAHFLTIAEGSLAETEYLVILSHDLEHLTAKKSQGMLAEIDEIGAMLHSLRQRVESRADP